MVSLGLACLSWLSTVLCCVSIFCCIILFNCKSENALRVPPAVTRLTVYRRLEVDHLGQIYDARPVFGAVAENTTSQPAVTAFATNFRHQRTCSCTPRVRENSLERERPRGLKSRSCSSRWARAGRREKQAEATEQGVREIGARRRPEWVYQCRERARNVHLTSASAVLDGGLVSWVLPVCW